MGRLVIERLSEGSVPPSDSGTRSVDAPTVGAIRMVFGVGKGPDDAPELSTFKPVYTVSVPVFSLGGLDSDGVHEFDAVSMLQQLQTRSVRRTWAMRVELEIVQVANTVNSADIYIGTPFADDGPSIEVAGRTKGGTTTVGGGRSLVLATSLAHSKADVEALAGTFTIQLCDADPQDGGQAGVESPVREVRLAFSRYEFEA